MVPMEMSDAHGVGREGSEFRTELDRFLDLHHSFHVEVEYPTAFVLTVGDRRLLVTAMQITDGRLAVELRGYVDDTMQPCEMFESGMTRLLTV